MQLHGKRHIEQAPPSCMIGPNYLSSPRSFSHPSLAPGNDNADLNGRQGMQKSQLLTQAKCTEC